MLFRSLDSLGFVNIAEADSSIAIDLMYTRADNFTGTEGVQVAGCPAFSRSRRDVYKRQGGGNPELAAGEVRQEVVRGVEVAVGMQFFHLIQ